MKRPFIVGGICASLLFGAAATAVAQDEHKNDKPPAAQPENRKDDARPDDRRNQEPQSGDRHPQKQENERPMQQPQDRKDKDHDRENHDRQNTERPNMEHPQAREQDRHEQDRHEDRRDQARPEGREQGRADQPRENRRHIPDSDFHSHFGRSHRFAPGRMQVYEGRPQFNYGGYAFEIFEPWPADWVYDQDDYYIDYVDDEYWLYSLRHPGMRLELVIIR
jgi:hypothetical protein